MPDIFSPLLLSTREVRSTKRANEFSFLFQLERVCGFDSLEKKPCR